jgi:hypothetical protein
MLGAARAEVALDQGTPVETPVDQCDVQDKHALTKYRELRQKWLRWVQAGPPHSIWDQLYTMVVNDIAAQTIYCAAENDLQSPLHNQLLVMMIRQGHRGEQILGVRRLWDDKRSSNINSLRQLLSDIKSNLNLLTREIYVSGDGSPYDASVVASVMSSPVASMLAEKAHQRFDRLARIPANRRERCDRIPRSLVNYLETYIKESGADDVVKWSHQFVAHAGDAQAPGWQEVEITFAKVEAVQRSIAQVVQLVSANLLQGPGLSKLVPMFQRNRFNRFEDLASPTATAKARERWDELERDRNSWLNNDWGSSGLLTAVGWPDAPQT